MILVMAINANAGIVSFEMTEIFDGQGIPTNPGPWVNVTFDDGGSPGTVDLTIAASGLDGIHEKVAGVYINLDPTIDPTGLIFSGTAKTGSFEDPVISQGADDFKADGDGYYDILISFDNTVADSAFNYGDTVTYTITLDGLTADSFDFLSAPGGGNGPYKTAAHLLSLGGEDGDSAWATVPEPATIGLLGLGTVLLRRRKK